MMEIGKAMFVNQTEHFVREHDELIPPFENPLLRTSLRYSSLAEMVAWHRKWVQSARQLSTNVEMEIPLSVVDNISTRSQPGKPPRCVGHIAFI